MPKFTKVHGWMAGGGASSDVVLPPGDYQLVSHQFAGPRVDAVEPPKSLPSDNGLSVSDSAGAMVLKGPGSFKVADAGSYRVTFGEPRMIELWQLDK